MKFLLKHDLPKKLRYAKVYLEVSRASLYFSLDGSKASLFGSIGGAKHKPVAISDKEYTSYRASRGVAEVVDQDEERVILKTVDGYEEEWMRPKWVLNGVRKARTGIR
jgi:hypothetical protein